MKRVKTRRSVVAVVAMALCALLPATASAQSETEKKQAREHYEMATRLYDVGKYGEAIAEYEQAYLLVGDAALLFNIGQAYRLWDRPEDAIRAYKNFLRQRPDASNRADVERKIADLEKLVEERRRSGAQPVQPGAVTPPPTTTAPYPPPTAPPMGYPTAPGVVPPPESGAPAGTPAQPSLPVGVAVDQTNPESEPPPPNRSWLIYSLFGVSAACLVTAGIAGAVAASKAKKMEEASQNREVFDPAVEQNGKAANAVAVLAGVLGVAAGGTAGYLLWRQRKSESPQVSIVPGIGPSYAGGSARVTF